MSVARPMQTAGFEWRAEAMDHPGGKAEVMLTLDEALVRAAGPENQLSEIVGRLENHVRRNQVRASVDEARRRAFLDELNALYDEHGLLSDEHGSF